eukprot:gene62374-85300_t
MARTLLGKPSILLLDEPLEGLAPVICDELMALLAKLAATNEVTIILVEQQIERALDFANSVMVMERGRTSWTGAPEVLTADRALVDRLPRRPGDVGLLGPKDRDAEQQQHDENRQEDIEEYARQIGRRGRDSGKAEDSGDDRHEKEDQRPFQKAHDGTPVAVLATPRCDILFQPGNGLLI